MQLKPITINLEKYPEGLWEFLKESEVYDSSSSEEANIIYIKKDKGYFLKQAEKGKLKHEATMAEYFNKKGLTTKVLAYISNEKDYLLTEKVEGCDCLAQIYLENPKRLCEVIAESLLSLHRTDFLNCKYFAPENLKKLLSNNALIHGDACLPNIILNNWKFSGYIDLDCAGIGNIHFDIYWVLWSLKYNLKIEKYNEYFIDAYGRHYVDKESLIILSHNYGGNNV